jgi:hypothetical protein
MSKTEKPTFPLRLTGAQRKVIGGLLPALRSHLLLDQTAQRTLQFTLDELKEIAIKCDRAVPKSLTGMERNSLRHVVDAATQALDHFKEGSIALISVSQRLYQFKITLKEIEPPIWRRIQVKDCTLDKMHERIQTAMGWTNSHLNQFSVNDQLYADPMLMEETFYELGCEDSTNTKLSDIVPKSGQRFSFTYEYDFGDGWKHDVCFEGCLRAEKGARYPLCLEGERACPPEDVGGVWGYQEFLEAMANPKHDRHIELIEWSGPFDPEKFDAQTATKVMRRGLPNWREQE